MQFAEQSDLTGFIDDRFDGPDHYHLRRHSTADVWTSYARCRPNIDRSDREIDSRWCRS
jgi:hypothetical protein